MLISAMVAGCSPASENGPVVLAASSMQEAIETAADAWAAQGNSRPVLSFSSSAVVARQVSEGAPADIAISADAEWMDWLEQRGLVDPSSRRNIAGNTLVWVRKDAKVGIPTRTAGSAPLASIHLALADPETVPAGRYARQALEHAGLWDRLAGMVVPAENVRAALALVERGEADLGVVYATDARLVPDLLITPLALPDGADIAYPAAITAASTERHAVDFLDFLGSAEGAAILCDYGFIATREMDQC